MISACKVFSASKHRERETLGEVVTAWLIEHPRLEVSSYEVRQSSDRERHCYSIILFMTEVTNAPA